MYIIIDRNNFTNKLLDLYWSSDLIKKYRLYRVAFFTCEAFLYRVSLGNKFVRMCCKLYNQWLSEILKLPKNFKDISMLVVLLLIIDN